VERSLRSEADIFSSYQEITSVYGSRGFHYYVHKRSPLATIFIEVNPVYNFMPCFFMIHFNIIFMPVLSSWYLTIRFPKRNVEFLLSPLLATCPTHLNVLDFVTLVPSPDQQEVRHASVTTTGYSRDLSRW
jgi:hypothetical protein